MFIITTTKIKEIGNKNQIRCFFEALTKLLRSSFFVVLADQGFYEHSIAAPKWLKNNPFPRGEIGTRARDLKWKNERRK